MTAKYSRKAIRLKRRRNERHSEWKIRITIFICRWYKPTYRKPLKIYTKNLPTLVSSVRWQTQDPKQSGYKEDIPQPVKATKCKPTANTSLSGEKLNHFLQDSKTRLSASTALIQHSTDSSSQNNKARKRRGRDASEKGGRITVLADNVLLCSGNLKIPPKTRVNSSTNSVKLQDVNQYIEISFISIHK